MVSLLRAVSAVLSSFATQAIINSLDAKMIACNSDSAMVYTSLNMSFVPEPHNSDEELQARADGHFGPVDCFQWPQVYCKEFEYTICIHRSKCHPSPDPLSWAWYHPSLDDFEPLPHTTFLVGQLKQEKALGVASLCQIAAIQYEDWKRTHGDKKDFVNCLSRQLTTISWSFSTILSPSTTLSYLWLNPNAIF
jgi:hypothetical protein